MHRWLDAAADLVIGASCPGCEQPGRDLCPRCAARLLPRPREVPVTGGLSVVAAGAYRGVGERVVRRWKGEGHADAARWAAHAAAACVVTLDVDRPLLVPVPATRRSRRRRGGWLVDDLARSAASVLAEHAGLSATVIRPARLRRQTADQRRLGWSERARNTRGAFSARRATSGRPVVIVDDVITTGATMRAMAEALTTAGWQVRAGVAVLATPAPGGGRSALVEGAGEG